MYPNITLRIENHKPEIILNKKEGESKVLVKGEEDIVEIVRNIILKLNLEVPEDEFFANVADLAEEGDETFGGEYPTIDSEEFRIKKSVNAFIDGIKKDEFKNYGEINQDILNELERNQNLDILASALDYMYYIIIAKTILVANEKGVKRINLEDTTENIRLQSKLSAELTRMEIDFEIV